jgi:Peptidase family S41
MILTFKSPKILFLCFFFAAASIHAQQKLTLAQQQEDFKIFKISMQEMHAGLYWFITPARFNSLYDSVYTTLKNNDDTEQFYMKVRYCMAMLKHGHDGVEMTNGETGINYKMNAMPATRKHLPFVMEYLGDRLYLLNNCSSNKNITNGSEIISINGKTITSLNKQMIQYIFANGRNTTYKYKMLGFYFQFHYLYQVLYPTETSYRLGIIPYKSTKKIVVTADAELPQTIADRYQQQTGKSINSWGKLIDYKMLDEKRRIGYCKLETFSTGRFDTDSVKLASELEKLFSTIKNEGIKSLLVDVRDNEGGDDTWQTAITYFRGIEQNKDGGLAYLQSDKFTQIQYVIQNDENRQLLQAFQYNPYALIDKTADGRFKLKPQFTEHDTKAKPIRPNAFKGDVYLLQNGLTFSAGFAFAGTLKDKIKKSNGFIKVIGEDNRDDMDAGVGSGGWSVELLLPNSKVKLNIPVTGGGDKPYTNPPVNFLDYKVIPTITNKLNGIDTELEFTKGLIEKRMNN